MISFRYCPFVIEHLALTGLRFGTFGAIKVGWVSTDGRVTTDTAIFCTIDQKKSYLCPCEFVLLLAVPFVL